VASVVGTLTGGVAGIAIGEAGSVALDPVFEPVKQDAWKNKATRILNEGQLAQLVAQALNAFDEVLDDVERNGFDSDELMSLVQLALKAPGVPEAEKLYLRSQGKYPGAITLKQLHHVYGKSQIEPQFWDALTAAAGTTLLTPAELALGAVRSTLDDQGLLVKKLDTSDSNVPQYQVAALNIIDEAAAAGVDRERLRALIGSVGLPMSTHEAASAYFRGILTLGGYNQSIEEGDVRPEWAPFILDQARQILTAHDWVEARLRGWIKTDAEMYAGTALHGMSQADTDLLFKITGRPLNIHQIVTAQARGGEYKGPTDQIPEEYLAAVQESNIRPEFYNLDYANRYTYPTGFQIKAETKDHTLSQQASYDLLLKIGWEPDLATLFSTAWYAPTATTNKHVVSSTTSLVTAARKAYIGGAANEQQARAALTVAKVDLPTQDELIALWDAQRTLESLPAPTG
jgi:hypothetical protein